MENAMEAIIRALEDHKKVLEILNSELVTISNYLVALEDIKPCYECGVVFDYKRTKGYCPLCTMHGREE